MKKILALVFVLLLSLSLVNAVTQQEINEAKSLIDSKADCESLSDSQLEIIGEYYMEQMHPGEAHELMHKMMGLKEGSEAEEQFHTNMARTMYCEESGGMMGSGMMGSGGMMNNMMGGGNMMGNYGSNYGMMGNYGYGINIFGWIIQLLVVIALILLIFWLFQKVTRKK